MNVIYNAYHSEVFQVLVLVAFKLMVWTNLKLAILIVWSNRFGTDDLNATDIWLYSSVVERCTCNAAAPGSNPGGASFCCLMNILTS